MSNNVCSLDTFMRSLLARGTLPPWLLTHPQPRRASWLCHLLQPAPWWDLDGFLPMPPHVPKGISSVLAVASAHLALPLGSPTLRSLAPSSQAVSRVRNKCLALSSTPLARGGAPLDL